MVAISVFEGTAISALVLTVFKSTSISTESVSSHCNQSTNNYASDFTAIYVASYSVTTFVRACYLDVCIYVICICI